MIKIIILQVLRVFISLLWAIIGAIFWVPFLARMITTFTVAVLVSVTRGTPMGDAERGLDAGVTFYIDGFKKISDSVNNIIEGKEPQGRVGLADAESIKVLFIQLLYTLTFWVATLLLLGFISLPIDEWLGAT